MIDTSHRPPGAPVTNDQSTESFTARRAALFEQALVGVGFLVLFFLLPHALVGDDLQRFTDIESLLHDGRLADSRYSLVMPVLSAPFLLIGAIVGTPEWWAARFNVIVVAVGTLVARRVVRGRVDPVLFRRAILVLLFASYLTDRLRDYNAEVLSGTLVALGILCLGTDRYVTAGWAAIVLGVVNTPAAMLGLVALAAAETVRTRRLRTSYRLSRRASWSWPRHRSAGAARWRQATRETTGFVPCSPTRARPASAIRSCSASSRSCSRSAAGLVFFAPGLLLWVGTAHAARREIERR